MGWVVHGPFGPHDTEPKDEAFITVDKGIKIYIGKKYVLLAIKRRNKWYWYQLTRT